MPLNDPDRLFPAEPRTRDLTRALYQTVADLPIVSPHGHCDPKWFATNDRFENPAALFVTPDHYVFRMLISQGVSPDALGIPRVDGAVVEDDPRAVWQRFASYYHLFRGTPSALWLDHAFEHVFGLDIPLCADTAEMYFDVIETQLSQPDYTPRALFERFGIEVLATTESALDDLRWHDAIVSSGWSGRVVTTYRPDAIIDPDFEGFAKNLEDFAKVSGEDTTHFKGYLAAHRKRRADFRARGATATDHGHPTAATADLSLAEVEDLFQTVRHGKSTAQDRELFRAHMLTEMARMSLEDGMVMQIHAGSRRNHSAAIFQSHGRDKGFDIPGRTDFVNDLKPLLDAVGMEPNLTIILFTLDETAYSRELAPLTGVYPALRLGPPWWFFDSFEGIRRFRETVTETCGFYNTVGFNDDTRAFCSIPARHDVSRRADCGYLANLVVTGRLREADAFELAQDLAVRLARRAYKL